MIPPEMLNSYILNLANKKAVVYFHHDLSTRRIDNWKLWTHRTRRQWIGWPIIFIHDQELLNFDDYTDELVKQSEFYQKSNSIFLENLNLRWLSWGNIYDRAIITHSEINSEQVEKYRSNGFEPVYFWSHAIIARDWLRYAEHDPALRNIKDDLPWKDFLVYSRGWRGMREYRLFMADLMIEHDLLPCSKYSILHYEDGQDIGTYSVENPLYQNLDLPRIKQMIPQCEVSSDASAIYEPEDFLRTGISVVLETNCTEDRIHLTEKTLRAIALAHPFILASAPGSLEYLRSYGFKTYDDVGINESYDREPDPKKRLEKICEEMSRIKSLPADDKRSLYKNLRSRARENRDHFFSKEFERRLFDELDDNFISALERVKSGPCGATILAHARGSTASPKYQMNKALLRKRRAPYIMLVRAHRNRMRRTIKDS